jgi:AcrR family transcriptional regulator
MIDAALTLLGRAGLAGAGINQVVALSGAPKGSVYHHFPGGKQELVTAALRQFDTVFRGYLAHQWSKPGAASDKVQQFVAGVARRLRAADYQEGCPVGGVILDLDPDSEPLREVCRDILDGWIDLIAARLDDLPPAQRREFAGFMVTALEGGLILSRAQRTTRPLIEAGQMLARHLGAPAPARGARAGTRGHRGAPR